MHLFPRIAAVAAVTFAPFGALSVAAPDVADATGTTAAATSSCSGSPGHGFFNASTGRYVTVDGNLMVANSPVDTRQWNVYYDNQPASPEYPRVRPLQRDHGAVGIVGVGRHQHRAGYLRRLAVDQSGVLVLPGSVVWDSAGRQVADGLSAGQLGLGNHVPGACRPDGAVYGQ